MEPIYADLDQIVFEGREQAYGGYDLRMRYRQNLGRALLIVTVAFLMVTVLPKALQWVQRQIFPTTSSGQTISCPKDHEKMVLYDAEMIKCFMGGEFTSIHHSAVFFSVPNPVPETPPETFEMNMATVDPPPITDYAFDQIGDWMDDYPWEEIDQVIGEGTDPFVGGPNGTEMPLTICTKPPVSFNPNELKLINQAIGESSDPIVGGPAETETPFTICTKPADSFSLSELNLKIGYPPEAYQKGIEGKVIVRVLVGHEGQYMKHVVLKDPHPILTEAVVSELKDFLFSPAHAEGKPIKVWVTIPIHFKLLR